MSYEGKLKIKSEARPGSAAGFHVESLESRRMLDGPLAVAGLLQPLIATSWPVAPFTAASSATPPTTIYVNQFGDATLKHQHFDPADPVNRYVLYWDDGNTLALSTTPTDAPAATDLAYYDHFDVGSSTASGPPTVVDTSGRVSGPAITALVSTSKLTQFAAVRPHNAAAVDAGYTLHVNGPKEGDIYPIDVLPGVRRTKSFLTGIGGTDDIDYWGFTLPRQGNWTVTVDPTPNYLHPSKPLLDSTLNIYDGKGNPIAGGGSFTSTIDNGGVGFGETWTGLGAGPGAYDVAVGGAGKSLGHYYLTVDLADVNDVTVEATRTAATAARSGQFAVTRAGSLKHGLSVAYTVAGTATAGSDYRPLSGVVGIAAGQSSAKIDVAALAGVSPRLAKSVMLTLTATTTYNLNGQNEAAVTVQPRGA